MSDSIDTLPAPPPDAETLPEVSQVDVPPWLDHVIERASEGGREAVQVCQEVLVEVRRVGANSELTRHAVNGLAEELRSHLSNHDREIAELRKADSEHGRSIARIVARLEGLEKEVAAVRDELREMVG